MKRKAKPIKIPKVLKIIKECIECGNYILTKHALERQSERAISLPETLYVLNNGHEEKRKTCFDIANNTWKYAIRGKTIRGSGVRVIVAFDEENMLIITVIQVE